MIYKQPKYTFTSGQWLSLTAEQRNIYRRDYVTIIENGYFYFYEHAEPNQKSDNINLTNQNQKQA